MASSRPTSGPPSAPGTRANRLAREPSPYLRQHAGNPVDWWPWGDAAFAEARRRGVPVFLSIGYATCHWCHVMAHESFEDPGVAALLNDAFVNVKVDREERPDVDDVYMAACQAATGSGGWPLSLVLTPDRKPFFAATYIPRTTRHGRLGMLDLVPRLAEAWATRRPELEAQAEHVLAHVRGEAHDHAGERHAAPDPGDGGAELGRSHLDAAFDALRQRFDPAHGGFGGAPKFPSPHNLLFLLRHHHRTGEPDALRMVEETLDALAAGGIRDHLGGGFHRYSTDARWLVPHFEKMLYDQALLALAYTEAFQATGSARHRDVARSVLDYVLRDLADPGGGLRCAEDADSEGEEGRFYVWRRDEVLAVLGPRDGEAFCQAYGVAAEGNHHDEATHRRTGTNILHLAAPLPQLEARLGADAAPVEARLAAMRARLLEARSRRARPLLDDKVVTDWNGLAIAALARAGRAFGEPRYLGAANAAARFVSTRMRGRDGRLHHFFHAGQRRDTSFLDDHAFMLWGFLELYEAGHDPAHLREAVATARAMEALFADPAGGFHPTPSDGEALPARRKDAYDGALPSGNAVAAWSLLRLAQFTGETHWDELADRTIQAFASQAAAHPMAFPVLLMAADAALGPSQEVLVAGETGAEALLAHLASSYHPRAVVLRIRSGLADVAPWTRGYPSSGAARAYVCTGNTCQAPVGDVAGLRRALAG